DVGVAIQAAGDGVVAFAAGQRVGKGKAVDGVVTIGAGVGIEIPDDVVPAQNGAVGEFETLDTIDHRIEQAVVDLALLDDPQMVVGIVDRDGEVVRVSVSGEGDVVERDIVAELHDIIAAAEDGELVVLDGIVPRTPAEQIGVVAIAAGNVVVAGATIQDVVVV